LRVVYGMNPVRELLRAGAEGITELWLAEGGDRPKAFADLERIARDHGAKVRSAPRARLDRLAGVTQHQGLVAVVADYRYRELEEILGAAREFPGGKFLGWRVEGADAETLSVMADDLAARAPGAVIFLAGVHEDRAAFVCKVEEKLVAAGVRAGDIVKAAAAAAEGRGGGKATFAQGGGKAELVEAALEAAFQAISAA